MTKWLLFGALALAALTACSGGGGDPAGAVEKYLQAKIHGDADALRALLCSAMEADLERETQTFISVSEVRLEGMSCERVGDGDKVACQGKIVALYGTEQTEFPLVSYRVVQEDGEWKWCGEAP
jgi:hypothetical protein